MAVIFPVITNWLRDHPNKVFSVRQICEEIGLTQEQVRPILIAASKAQEGTVYATIFKVGQVERINGQEWRYNDPSAQAALPEPEPPTPELKPKPQPLITTTAAAYYIWLKQREAQEEVMIASVDRDAKRDFEVEIGRLKSKWGSRHVRKVDNPKSPRSYTRDLHSMFWDNDQKIKEGMEP